MMGAEFPLKANDYAPWKPENNAECPSVGVWPLPVSDAARAGFSRPTALLHRKPGESAVFGALHRSDCESNLDAWSLVEVPSVRCSPAIVLRSWPYGESDKIVSFLTRDFGKIKGIAKGAKRSRRRFLNVLEPFALVSLRFHRRPHSSLVFIDACDWVHPFRLITKSLAKIAHASYLVEITDEFTKENDENRALFEHLHRGLRFLELNDPSPTFLTAFDMTLLRLCGYEPMLGWCRRCGVRPLGPDSADAPHGHASSAVCWGFSPRDGGILCRECSRYRKETIPLSLSALGVLAHFRDQRGTDGVSPEFPVRAIRETRQILPMFIQYQISKRLKSVVFLDASL